MGNVRARIAESLDELRALDAEIDAWHDRWDESYAIGKHRTQLDLLAELTSTMIDLLIGGISKLDLTDDAAVYAECRQADERLQYVRKLWRYYADKLDQRAGLEGDPMTQTLRAADEVIWSCWKTALKNLGADPKFYLPAPLAFLSPQFAASTDRSFPQDLRPPVDKLLAAHISQLPIPLIALPPMCQRRPWWLVVAAHEVGHHVQWTVPGAMDRTRDALTAALGSSRDAPWLKWHPELFADACAVLLTGPAAIWAITELETAPVKSTRYPPPEVRLAVARTLAGKAGLLDSPLPERQAPGLAPSPPAGNGDGDRDIEELIACVPKVADAMLEVTSGSGPRLRALASATARAYQDGVEYWEKALLGSGTLGGDPDLGAARFCVAGSVAAWQSVASRDGSDEELARWTAVLAERVRGVLPDCAERGTRGASWETDVKARSLDLASQFVADLDATDLLDGDDDEPAGGAGQP